jgi:hypothetical protein
LEFGEIELDNRPQGLGERTVLLVFRQRVHLVISKPLFPAHFRTTPGGYFHGMVAKAKAGELNLDRTLLAMRRATDPKPRPKPAPSS